MNYSAIRWALETPGLRPSHRLLLLCFAYYANKELLTYPSSATLVERSGLDRKTVLAGTAWLQSQGMLTDLGERRGHGVRMFSINVPEAIPETGQVEPVLTHPENGTPTGPVFPTTHPENGTPTGPKNGIQKLYKTDLEGIKNISARVRGDVLKTSDAKISKVEHRGTNTTPPQPLPAAPARAKVAHGPTPVSSLDDFDDEADAWAAAGR